MGRTFRNKEKKTKKSRVLSFSINQKTFQNSIQKKDWLKMKSSASIDGRATFRGSKMKPAIYSKEYFLSTDLAKSVNFNNFRTALY
jgi:hypothetical protein